MKLMTHIVAGYPTLKKSENIAMAMYESGVSFIEVQIPFSDPIADGETITHANEIAIKNGVTTQKSLDLIKKLKKKIKIPILIMTYFNIAFNYGLEDFCKTASGAGVYGLIIPDMPIDEENREHYLRFCKKYKLHAIQVISPITTIDRLKLLNKHASGFVYCVSTLGTTGTRNELNPELKKYVTRVKKYIDVPIAVGFGISTKQQAQFTNEIANIVTIGSKIINVYNSAKTDKIKAISSFLRTLYIPH